MSLAKETSDRCRDLFDTHCALEIVPPEAGGEFRPLYSGREKQSAAYAVVRAANRVTKANGNASVPGLHARFQVNCTLAPAPEPVERCEPGDSSAESRGLIFGTEHCTCRGTSVLYLYRVYIW